MDFLILIIIACTFCFCSIMQFFFYIMILNFLFIANVLHFYLYISFSLLLGLSIKTFLLKVILFVFFLISLSVRLESFTFSPLFLCNKLTLILSNIIPFCTCLYVRDKMSIKLKDKLFYPSL